MTHIQKQQDSLRLPQCAEWVAAAAAVTEHQRGHVCGNRKASSCHGCTSSGSTAGSTALHTCDKSYEMGVSCDALEQLSR